ncbi:NAD(P)/FAD-dependent oxidoreductase [Flaviramulus sp. BrNp1-15]|uniref:NAD(P)/FAD-dependent oxidoreductase n=1 Tax=Flaviramulus sp. BrNp1-15 TaxID=2916754 RepID=UPI001EE8E341|nr:FAD/NAD(P)-binding oxidoreductase [Flaviramulus sp. BrNp1-15]ULC57896.1 NAD(P)/FAD-dependent oxidoreductase [Flaviramulus sp. BrNp1-15]
MKTHHQIIIVGGGTAGIMTASLLLKKSPLLDVAIIEPSDTHWYQPAWTLVGAGSFNYNRTKRPMVSVIPKNAKWIRDSVVSFDPENNIVITGSFKNYSYDYLIVCPGLKLDTSLVAGLPNAIDKGVVCSNYTNPNHTWQVIKNFKGGTALFTQPPKPYKCGGAPQKIMYLADDYFKKHNLKDKTKVVFATSGDALFSVTEITETLKKIVNRRGINVKFEHELKKIDSKNQIAWFKVTEGFKEMNPTEVELHDKDKLVGIKYDMLHLVPPNTAPDFIKNSPLVDNSKWVDIDPYTLQHRKYPNIFSLGDVSNLPTSKTGAAIRKQAPVVVYNLINLIELKKLSNKTYNGYSSCPFITGYGKMVLAEFDYDKNFTPDPKLMKRLFIKDSSQEHWRLWVLKKYILPYLYWNKLLKGIEI